MAVTSPRWGDADSTMRNLKEESVDLGLDNLAALIFKNNPECYIINGKLLNPKMLTSIKKLQDYRVLG